MEVSENISGTLRAQQHGHQPLVFEPRSQDGVPRVGNQNISPTLNTGGVDNDNHVSYNKTFTHNAYDTIVESETSSTLKANGENYGGVGIICDSTVGALQARDCKGVGNQYVNEGKLIIDARQNRNT